MGLDRDRAEARVGWRRGAGLAGWLVLSAVLHAAAIVGASWLPGQRTAPAPSGPITVALIQPPAPPPPAAAPVVPAPVPQTDVAPPRPRAAPAPARPAARRARPPAVAGPAAPVLAPAATQPADAAVAPEAAPEGDSWPESIGDAGPAGAGEPPAPAPVAAAAPSSAEAVGPSMPAGDGPASPAPVPPAEPSRPPLPHLTGTLAQRFRVFWGDYADRQSVARLQYRVTIEGDRYEIRTEGEAEGLISLVYRGTLSQVSRGRLGPDGLEPMRYVEQRGQRAERSVTFDQDGRRLLPHGGGPPLVLPPGTQDRLSVVYQISLMARADPVGFAAAAEHRLPVASLRAVRIEAFTVLGEETLVTPEGPLRALHLRRLPLSGGDEPGIDLWLGYDLDMLPVRLRVEDASRRVLDQVLERGG
jgi:hypothetical protein